MIKDQWIIYFNIKSHLEQDIKDKLEIQLRNICRHEGYNVRLINFTDGGIIGCEVKNIYQAVKGIVNLINEIKKSKELYESLEKLYLSKICDATDLKEFL